jgi:hypothetical protein
MANASDLAKKLNLKDGMRALVLGKPDDVDLEDIETTDDPAPEAVIAFARDLGNVDSTCGPVIEAAKHDRIAWIAYPKAGQLGTDLNRDVLWKHLQEKGVQAVRQVSLNGVWSAMRFRPAE